MLSSLAFYPYEFTVIGWIFYRIKCERIFIKSYWIPLGLDTVVFSSIVFFSNVT